MGRKQVSNCMNVGAVCFLSIVYIFLVVPSSIQRAE
jgi:hypothetical protein